MKPRMWCALIFVFLVMSSGCTKNQPKMDEEDNREQPKSPVVLAKERSAQRLKRIVKALHQFHDDFGHFPPAEGRTGALIPPAQPLSWRVDLLPYLEARATFDQLTSGKFPLAPDAGNDSWNRPELLNKMPLTFADPRQEESGTSSKSPYRLFVRNGAAFEMSLPLNKGHFRDGPGKTILVVESGDLTTWTKSTELTYDPFGPLPKLGGLFEDGFHVALADGSIWWIPNNPDEKLLRAMITRSGSENLDKLPGKKVLD